LLGWSANFDNRSFKLNFEANAFMYDGHLTKELERVFKEDLKQSGNWPERIPARPISTESKGLFPITVWFLKEEDGRKLQDQWPKQDKTHRLEKNMQRMINPWTIGLIALLGYFAIRDGVLNDPATWLMDIIIMPPELSSGCLSTNTHALVAYKLGDDTQNSGRVTINPCSHWPHRIFSILLIRFGWGKPVEIYPGTSRTAAGLHFGFSSGVMMNLFLQSFSPSSWNWWLRW
jgi:hypothetical protein